ncbi:RVT-2 multi-domain protein [Pyrenophora tritici-repentis]|nr:RVT-2 multi-domain protein [Pyrenophora tritici-repentis]KAI1680283.1 RVT-2 multi-domain protein [Pyrenophora tritici-repentis]
MKAAFSASQQGYPLKDAFILDSGSTTHICNDLSRIEDVRPSTPGDYIWAGSSKVWIRGYGAVTLTTEGSQDKQALHIVNVAWCPDFLCSLVSFRLLRRQGIWWDNREDPTSLRRWDGTIIAILSERHGQWIIEDTTPFDSAFHVRMNRTKRSPQRATAMLWHKRLGHPGPSAIEHLIQQSEGVRIKGITTVQCDACGRSKSKRQIRRALRLNDEGPGERIAIDFHEYEADSFTKEKSQMLITCRNSRYVWDFYFKDNRPARSIIRLLALFIQFMKKQFNITVKVIETDNEIVTVKQEVEKWCTSLSIRLEPSAPDTQAQNGGAERSGGVIKEKARAIRLDANLPWELWPEITRAAVYLYNRTPNYPNKWKSPYEIFFTRAAATNGIVTGPRRPNQAHLRAYGCKAFAMTDDTHRGKSRLQRLDPKAWIGYLVGYQSTNIYRIWIPSMAKVISTRDVVFNEDTIFNGKTEDLMDNLMHNTLEEIATWVRTVELPGTQSQQPETETFYEDDTTQEESPRTQKTRYHQGRKVVEAYLTPPPTPPPVALLVQGEVNNEDMTNMSNQSTSMTNPWAAAFMAGTESGHIEIGFSPVPHEPCCMIRDGVFIFFYVDDIILASSKRHAEVARKVEEELKQRYNLTGGKDLQWFLGVEVIRDREKRKIWLSQKAYVEKIARLATNKDQRHNTPMARVELVAREGLATPGEINLYQRKIGSLLFAAVNTRPDVAFPDSATINRIGMIDSYLVSRLARFLTNPGPLHQEAADRVLLYLESTKLLSLSFGGDDQLVVASDASFADNTADRKSSQGYVIKLFGGLIAWRANKQDTITTSTTEAELLALSQVAKESMFVRMLLEELRVELTEKTITIQCDNTQTIRLINEEISQLTTKLRHVDIHNHWLRQEAKRKSIRVVYVPSGEMLADGFTKTLPANNWPQFLTQVGLVEVKERDVEEADPEEILEKMESLVI